MSPPSAPVSSFYPSRRGTRPVNAEDLWTLPRVGAPAPMPDGSALVVPVSRWNLEKNESRTQLYMVPIAGGTPRVLTTPDASSAEPCVSPDGKRLVFTRKDASGKPQLMLMGLNGRERRHLPQLPPGV